MGLKGRGQGALRRLVQVGHIEIDSEQQAEGEPLVEEATGTGLFPLLPTFLSALGAPTDPCPQTAECTGACCRGLEDSRTSRVCDRSGGPQGHVWHTPL